jgi:uncharacterized protein (TIGR01777 family)
VNVFIAGGTGFIGTGLTGMLLKQGYNVTILTRKTDVNFTPRSGLSFITGDVTKSGLWQNYLAEQDVVFNLAGMSIFRRWTENSKRKIIASRTLTTSNIVRALQERKKEKVTLINVSGVGYYGHHGDEFLAEDNPPGSDFLAQLAAEWETEAMKAKECGARVVVCRLGHVQGADGGMVPRLAGITRLGLGGRWGDGRQWLSWIHKRDLIKALLYLLDNPEIAGPVNICSPHPVRNIEMMETYASILRVRTLIPVIPGFLLRIMLGEFADAFLNGQRVIPAILSDSGFQFSFPFFRDALSDLLVSDEY